MKEEFKTEYTMELREIINNTSNKNYERDLIVKLLDYCLDDETITEEEYKTIKKTIKLNKKKQPATKEILLDSIVASFSEKIGLAHGLTVNEPCEEVIFLYDEKKKAIELTSNGKFIYSFNDFMLFALKALFDNLEKTL